MVSAEHKLSHRRQCALLQLARSNLYCQPVGESTENLRFLELIDKQFLETPWSGSRQMARHMQRQGHKCGRHPCPPSDAQDEALARYGPPEIMNRDQGSQVSGHEWTNAMTGAGVLMSMDGRGRWIDTRMIERLWRSVKYECIYLNAFQTGAQGLASLTGLPVTMNTPHSTHAGLTPSEAYETGRRQEKMAAGPET